MKLFKILILLSAVIVIHTTVSAQANAYINILTQNSGLVNLGGTVNIQIEVGNTGPNSIAASKIKTALTVPVALVSILPNAQQTGLPPGWTILSNTAGGVITLCNGTDVIPANQQRTILIKVQGNNLGGPSTLIGQLSFSGGTNCGSPGSLSGNSTADDNSTSSIQVVAGCSLGVTAAAGSISCNGGSTILTATPTGASGAVEYSITGAAPFQTSNIFTVPAGTYTITAREVANPATCVATVTIPVIEPSAVAAPTISITQPDCSIATGTAAVTSATANFTFSIDGNGYAAYPAGGYILSPGAHTLQAKNLNGCASPVTTVIINTQPPTPNAPTIDAVTQPDCLISTGTVSLSGLSTGNWIINPGNITGNSNTKILNGLVAGTYSFTVTNAAGCTSAAAPTVNINTVIGSPDAPAVLTLQPACALATGSITITSATAGLTFSLDGGSFAAYPVGGYTGLAAGNHTLIAQNINGCLSPFTNIIITPQPTAPAAPAVNVLQPSCTIATGIITVTSVTTGLTFSFDGGSFAAYPVGGYTATAGSHTLAAQNTNGCTPATTNNIIVNAQPASPSAIIAASEISCFGGNSTITITAAGGILPYEFSLNNGTFQSANTFNIPAGTFTVIVKDANGCTGTSNNVTVVQPAVITASLSAGTIACNGGTAVLNVLAAGGSGTLEYSLNNGAFQPGNTFTVTAGTYSAKVRPITNPTCVTTTSAITVVQPNTLIASATAKAINQCGGTTEVKVTASGGKLPYSGTGSFIKGPGESHFSVTDANGCTAISDITILPPGCVDLKVFPNPAQDHITVNHSSAGPEATIQIFEMNGSLVLSRKVPKNAFITTVDISKISSSMYLLVYVNGDERKEIKFIKYRSQ
jgi:hypothetical protein